MSEEIRKNAQDAELNPEELEKVAGGYIYYDDGEDYGEQGGQVIAHFNTYEEAQFYASGICPRCGKTFASGSNDVLEHIKGWASGQK